MILRELFADADDGDELVDNHRWGVRGGIEAKENKVERNLRRKFIAWDTEGQNLRGFDRPQSTVVLSNSETEPLVDPQGLTTFTMWNHIIDVGMQFPKAFHVGYGFSYDMNMFIKGLNDRLKVRLHKHGSVHVKAPLGQTFVLSWKPQKSITITRRHSDWSTEKTNAKDTVTIEDIAAFFASTFVTAVEGRLGKNPSPNWHLVKEGKKHRGGTGECSTCLKNNVAKCPFDNLDYVLEYAGEEITVMAQLAEALRSDVYGAGFTNGQWYGPGALATDLLKRYGVKEHLAELPDDVNEAAQYAYGGGRFELYKLGRVPGPVYAYDIRSAYPAAMLELPSLKGGRWRHYVYSNRGPNQIKDFAMYHVSFGFGDINLALPQKPISPLFFRDRIGNISYPWQAEGWYWGPEIKMAREIADKYGIPFTIKEAHVFYPANDVKPFAFLADEFKRRNEMKRAGNPSQMALKVGMNAVYGKLAQRLGYKEGNDATIPSFHNLAWAGYITSSVRAKLYRILGRQDLYPYLVAVETDGFYITRQLSNDDLPLGDNLGDFEFDIYDELLYLQSGLAWVKHADTCNCDSYCTNPEWDFAGWQCKRRGMELASITLDMCIQQFKELLPNQKEWPKLPVHQRRFIGLAAAIQRKGPIGLSHCLWDDSDSERQLDGMNSKRAHIRSNCDACTLNLTAWEKAHTLSARKPSPRAGNPVLTGGSMDAIAEAMKHSHKHFIPWRDNNIPEDHWMNHEDEFEDTRDYELW